MVDRDNASDRVNPKHIGTDQTNPQTLAQNRNIDTLLPYLFILNADSIVHTITLTFRMTGGGTAPTVSFTVEANKTAAIPTLPFAAIACDSAGAPANVWMVYSDIEPPGPSKAAGSGTAATVANIEQAAVVTPSAGGANQMAGLGAVGTLTNPLLITPKKSGVVRFTVMLDWQQAASGDALTGFARYGTGAAPAKNAVASGTQISEFLDNQAAGIGSQKTITIDVVVTGLTLNTTYWFDLSLNVTQATDAVEIFSASVVEEGA